MACSHICCLLNYLFRCIPCSFSAANLCTHYCVGCLYHCSRIYLLLVYRSLLRRFVPRWSFFSYAVFLCCTFTLRFFAKPFWLLRFSISHFRRFLCRAFKHKFRKNLLALLSHMDSSWRRFVCTVMSHIDSLFVTLHLPGLVSIEV